MEITVTDFLEHMAKDIAIIEKECFSVPWSENAIINSFKNSTYFAVAVLNGKIIGYGGIQTVLDEGYITNIAVLSAYRKIGAGKKILAKIFEYAKEKNLSFVSLEVRKSNTAAINLYSSFGFVNQGLRRNFYTQPTEDALIMTKRFDDK